MNRQRLILDGLREELGFASRLVGGEKTVLAQIDRFLSENDVPEDLDMRTHPDLWNRLIGDIVIPETSFFRHAESFAALAQWIASRRPAPVHCLCLPCSTGEEAWSIAMTLREAGRTGDRIDAADASARSIAHARRGRYLQRSLRGLPAVRRERWFADLDDAVVVAPELRPHVDFRVANAFSLPVEPRRYDVIFCRNLLIYFDSGNQARLFARLASWLRPDGVLFLGPGEATVAASHGWRGTGHPMSFSFVRSQKPPRPGKKFPAPPPVRKKSLAPSALPRKTETAPPVAVDWLGQARQLADLGRSAEAREALEKFHRAEDASSESLLLRGLLAESAGHRAEAEADYRRALYLEPDNAEALLHLSLLLEADGRSQVARPFRRRLERLAPAP